MDIRQQEPAAVSRIGWRKYGSATLQPPLEVLSLAAFAGKVLCLAVFVTVLMLHAGISP
jgi:hypothetical protein